MPLHKLTHGCWFPAGSHFEVAPEDTIKQSVVLEQASPIKGLFLASRAAEEGLRGRALQAENPLSFWLCSWLHGKDERPGHCCVQRLN